MSEPKIFEQNDTESNKGLAIVIAIFTILFFLPLVMEDKKNSAYLKHVANQTLICLLTSVAVSVVGWILIFIPYIGVVLRMLLSLAVFALWIINIVYTAQANGKSLPIIGEIEIIK